MPTNDPGRSSIIDGVVSLPWVSTLRALASRESTTRLALDACGFMAIGNWRDDGRLLQQGLMLYSRALHEANKALRDPVQAQSDDVLATVRILGMCEMFRGDGTREAKVTSQGTDWLRHVEGTEKLLEWRGPENCSAEHGHELFVDSLPPLLPPRSWTLWHPACVLAHGHYIALLRGDWPDRLARVRNDEANPARNEVRQVHVRISGEHR